MREKIIEFPTNIVWSFFGMNLYMWVYIIACVYVLCICACTCARLWCVDLCLSKFLVAKKIPIVKENNMAKRKGT